MNEQEINEIIATYMSRPDLIKYWDELSKCKTLDDYKSTMCYTEPTTLGVSTKRYTSSLDALVPVIEKLKMTFAFYRDFKGKYYVEHRQDVFEGGEQWTDYYNSAALSLATACATVIKNLGDNVT